MSAAVCVTYKPFQSLTEEGESLLGLAQVMRGSVGVVENFEQKCDLAPDSDGGKGASVVELFVPQNLFGLSSFLDRTPLRSTLSAGKKGAVIAYLESERLSMLFRENYDLAVKFYDFFFALTLVSRRQLPSWVSDDPQKSREPKSVPLSNRIVSPRFLRSEKKKDEGVRVFGCSLLHKKEYSFGRFTVDDVAAKFSGFTSNGIFQCRLKMRREVRHMRERERLSDWEFAGKMFGRSLEITLNLWDLKSKTSALIVNSKTKSGVIVRHFFGSTTQWHSNAYFFGFSFQIKMNENESHVRIDDPRAFIEVFRDVFHSRLLLLIPSVTVCPPTSSSLYYSSSLSLSLSLLRLRFLFFFVDWIPISGTP
jgi:hypothetical protein